MSNDSALDGIASGPTIPARDLLDDKVNRLFAGKVVRKDSYWKIVE